MKPNRSLRTSARVAAAMLLIGALAACSRMPRWNAIEHWDHADAHVLGSFESYKPQVSESGRRVMLDLKPDHTATLAVSYVWKTGVTMLKGTWKREEDVVLVTIDGPSENREPLRFELKEGVLKNTAWNQDEFGSRGLGELRAN